MSDSSPAHSARLASLAILRANWDAHGQSWLDSFDPFVAEALRQSSVEEVDEIHVQRTLRKQFGIEIPAGAVRTILRRLARRGLVIQKNHRYTIVRKALDSHDLSGRRQEGLRQQAALVDKFCDFAKTQYRHKLTRRDAETALHNHVEQLALPLVRTALRGAPYQGDEYVLAAFIDWLVKRDPEGFEYLETMVKGSMLANALYVTDVGSAVQRFQQLVVYFDTPFLLNALGYVGKEVAQPADELLNLVRVLGGQCACFDQTVSEIQRVLEGIARTLRSIAGENSTQRQTAQLNSVEEHFLREGLSPADIEILAIKLERHLQELGIRVRPAPYQRQLGIDKDVLDAHLRQEVRYQKRQALIHDRNALMAIWQLRGGQAQRKLETSRAIFVTTNAPLVRAARAFFEVGSDGWTWPLAILDHDLTTVAWLKRPFDAPDLPRAQIIADSFAAMRPNTQLWERYLVEIEKLHKRGSVALEDFAALRYSPDARRALMDITLGDPGAMSSDTVYDVLRKTQEDVLRKTQERASPPPAEHEPTESVDDGNAEATERIEEVEGRLQRALAELGHVKDALRSVEGAQRNLVKRRAQRWATAAATAAFIILASLVVASTLASLPSSIGFPRLPLPTALQSPARAVLVLSVVGGVVMAVLDTVTGISVRAAVAKLRRALTDRLEARFLRQFDQDWSGEEE
jgi:hypothetical protein